MRRASWTQRDGTSSCPASRVADFREGKIRSFRTYFDDVSLIERIVGADESIAMEFHVEDQPDPLDIEVLETQIRHAASAPWDSATKSIWRSSCATPARSSPASADGPGVTAVSCRAYGCEPSLRGRGLATRLIAAAEAEAAARGCSQTVHFTYAFQARALYEQTGYELVGRVEDFPSGTDVLWYRKRLNPRPRPAGNDAGPTKPSREHRRLDDRPRPASGDAVIQPDGVATIGHRPSRAYRQATSVT